MKKKLALATLLLAAGCPSKDNNPGDLFPPLNLPVLTASISPESPLVNQWATVAGDNIHYLDQDIAADSNNDGDPANDRDVLIAAGQGSVFYTQGGRFIARAINQETGQTLDLEVYVRESDAFDRVMDQMDGNSKILLPNKWDTFVEPYLMQETASNFKSLKDLLAFDGLVISNYHINETGIWAEIRTTLPGITDSDNDGNVEYFGRFALPSEPAWQALSPLEDILGQAYVIQPPVKAWTTIEQEKPANATVDLNAEIPLNLPGQSPWGNVLNEYVFRYQINGKQVVTGINYKQLPRSSDQPIVDAFEALTTGATPQVYDPRGILIIPEGTKAEIREAIAQRKAYDTANN